MAFDKAKLMPARVVGGGHIQVLGTMELEFNLRETDTEYWHTFKETFHLIDGPRTCILGMTFHSPNCCIADVGSGQASYALSGGGQFSTPISSCVPSTESNATHRHRNTGCAPTIRNIACDRPTLIA